MNRPEIKYDFQWGNFKFRAQRILSNSAFRNTYTVSQRKRRGIVYHGHFHDCEFYCDACTHLICEKWREMASNVVKSRDGTEHARPWPHEKWPCSKTPDFRSFRPANALIAPRGKNMGNAIRRSGKQRFYFVHNYSSRVLASLLRNAKRETSPLEMFIARTNVMQRFR